MLHASSLSGLHRHRADLQRCAALFGQVQSHVAAAQRGLAAAARDWRSAMSDMRRRIEQLESDLSDAGTAVPNPLGDMTLLLCTGAITQVGGACLNKTAKHCWHHTASALPTHPANPPSMHRPTTARTAQTCRACSSGC